MIRPVSVLTLTLCIFLTAACGPAKAASNSIYRLPVVHSGGQFGLDSSWGWRNPTPHGHSFRAIATLPDGRGWAVGAGGLLARTNDGGLSWELMPRPALMAAASLSEIRATSSGALWVLGFTPSHLTRTSAGGDTVIYRSVDGGASWTAHSPPQLTHPPSFDFTISSISATSADAAWVIGGVVGGEKFVYTTEDGGRSWRHQRMPVPSMGGVFSVSPTIGLTNVDGRIMRTSDAGATWTTLQLADADGFLGFAALSEGEVWAVGASGTIHRTVDGGASWSELPLGLGRLRRVSVLSSGDAWVQIADGSLVRRSAAGALTAVRPPDGLPEGAGLMATSPLGAIIWWPGFFAATVDGGATWGPTFGAATYSDLIAVAAPTGQDAWVVAQEELVPFVGSRRQLLHTADGGATWVEQTVVADRAIGEVAAWSASNAWALVGSQIYSTGDAGSTWQLRASGSGLDQISLPSAGVVWTAGPLGNTLRSVDDGESWESADGPYQDPGFGHRLVAASATTAWFASDRGIGSSGVFFTETRTHIWKTVDGGRSWASQTAVAADADLTAATAVSEDVAFFVMAIQAGASHARLLRTGDGGATWTEGTLPHPGVFSRVHGLVAASPRALWAVGSDGYITSSTDGGATWSAQPSPTSNTLYAVAGTPGQALWTVGVGGTILRLALGSPNSRSTPAP